MSLKNLLRATHGHETLKAALEEHLVTREPDFREAGWHPSAFSGICERRLVLERLLKKAKASPERVDSKMQRIFDVGKALHAWYQNQYFGAMGVLWGRWVPREGKARWGFRPESPPAWDYDEIPFEVKLQDCDDTLYGHADGVVKVRSKFYVLELKTSNTRNFGLLTEADPKHIAQATTYMELINKGWVKGCSRELIPHVDGAIILYINKDDSREKEYFVPYDEVAGAIELQRPRTVDTALRDKILPEREEECPDSKAPCAVDCPMSSACFKYEVWKDLPL